MSQDSGQDLAEKQLETQLAEQLARLAHDLRGPLNAIIGFAELLHDGAAGPLSTKQKDYVAEVLAGSRQMTRVMDARLRQATPEARPSPSREGHPILVVADAATQEQLQDLLAAEGHDVRAASLEHEVLSVLESFRPRVVLLDLELEDVAVLELVKKLRTDPSMRDATIVGLTPCAARGEEAVGAGCDGYVMRPIEARSLAGMIRGYLWTPRARAARKGHDHADRAAG